MNVAPALNISHILPNAKICLEDACSLCEVLRFIDSVLICAISAGRVARRGPSRWLSYSPIWGVTKTHSRPHVSDDNPFSESQFRTMKYRPQFPDRFGCIQGSRAFCQGFFRCYNDEHCHSGVGLLTPATVHYGQVENALRQRQDVLDVAYQRHPERFVRSTPKPPALPSEVWINKPVSTPELLPMGGGRT